jgi:hypothetical protein
MENRHVCRRGYCGRDLGQENGGMFLHNKRKVAAADKTFWDDDQAWVP